ncbi:MAG: signal transduction histidine kinase, partial [Chlamydiales bacterium]|jgi:signal transduction histidine kinase
MRETPEESDPSGLESSEAHARLVRLEQSCNELLGSQAARSGESLPAQQLQRLLEISRSMNQIHDRDGLLSYVRDRLRELFDAENSFVIMLDSDHGPRIQSTNLQSLNSDGVGEDRELPISETILNQVIATRRPLLIDNTADAPALRDQRSVLHYKIASVLCAPLIVDERVIGVLHFDQRGTPAPFSTDDLRLLSLFAEQAATAFRNLELIERLNLTVTEIQSVQAAVVRAERLSALGEMAAGIAHDFNNMLLVALGMCDLLLARDGFDAEARSSIGTIRTCALDAASTVRRLLNFTRDSQEQPPGEAIRLDKIVAEMPLFTRHKWWDEARKRGATIEVDLQIDSAPHVLAAPSEIREIMMNLIFNAADAIERQGTITLSTGAQGERAFIAVADDGAGMDGSTLERAFNPFFSTKGARGCGFGLSTCEGMAKRLGGSIECTTELGQGSRLTL